MKPIMQIAISVALLGATASALAATSYTIAVPQKVQEHSQWCWAGVSQMVLSYKGFGTTQCATANYSLGLTNACGNTTFDWNSTANRPNYTTEIARILNHFGVSATYLAGTISQSSSVTRLDANRPYVVQWSWTGGGGHFVVVRGYASSGATLYIKDPWPGMGAYTRNFASTVSAADRTWGDTVVTN